VTERRGAHRKSRAAPGDPFAVLGLPARGDLTDEDVRAAWRRIAAATHPDLEDGGDPARFSAAAAAYDTLRTSFGRGEALADLGQGGRRGAARRPHGHGARREARTGPVPGTGFLRHRRGFLRYIGYAGRAAPGKTALRAGSVAAAAAAVAVAGWTPATIGLLVGAATWLLASHSRRP
jgi:curved DNA-binding protein CbpA